MNDDEHGDLREGRGCIDPVFKLKQKGEKAREKKNLRCMWVL